MLAGGVRREEADGSARGSASFNRSSGGETGEGLGDGS